MSALSWRLSRLCDQLCHIYVINFSLTLAQDNNRREMMHLMDSQRLTTLMQRYNAGERGALEAELAAFVGPLLASGWFELFAPAEWMRGDNPARRLLGTLAQAELNGPQK